MEQQDMLLRGTLVDLKTAQEEIKKEPVRVWQTDSLKKQIEKAGLRKKGYMMPLMDAEDVTEEECQLAKDFMPEVKLTGLELRSERRSKAWGGAYFRVVKDTENKDNRVIQWIYVWTKQRFFVSFWVTVLPLFLLGVVGTLIYSYLDFKRAILSVALIGTIYLILGLSALKDAIKGLTKGKYYFSNGQLFIIFGAVFWSLLLEMYLREKAVIKNIDEYMGVIEDSEGFFENILLSGHDLSLSWVSLLFFVAAGIALIFLRVELPSFTHATHDMDWAPLFIYIKKRGDEWNLDKIRYDAFHYFAETQSLAALKSNKSLSGKKRVKLEIPNFWHSFQLKTGFNNWIFVLVGFITLIVAILLAIIVFVLYSDEILAADLLRFVILPVLLFLGAYLSFSKWPSDVVNKKLDFSDSKNHLTEDRLRIFWNLRGEEPALKVRSKLQDPFMDDDDFNTFRDDLEQIVFYTLLPKLTEIQQQLFFEKL